MAKEDVTVNCNNIIVEDFPQRLKVLRSRLGKTQGEIADSLSITLATYSAWERGTRVPRLKYLTGLASYFDVPLTTFIKEEYDKAVVSTDQALDFDSDREQLLFNKILIFNFFRLNELLNVPNNKTALFEAIKSRPQMTLGFERLEKEQYFAVLYRSSDMVCADPTVSVPPSVLLLCRTCDVDRDFNMQRFALVRVLDEKAVKLRRVRRMDAELFELRSNDEQAEPQAVLRDNMQVFGICLNFTKVF